MDAYTTYEFYNTHFPKRESSIKKADFLFYALKAAKVMDVYTFGRIKDLTEEIQMCCCEVAENLYSADQDQVRQKGLVSQKTADVSETYETSSNRQLQTEQKNKQAVYAWLSGTGLLYRGLQ